MAKLANRLLSSQVVTTLRSYGKCIRQDTWRATEGDDSPDRCGGEALLVSGHPIALTGETFDKHIERNDMPVIVDFRAEWRLPCRAMAPVFDRAARELEPRARFAKLNVDEEPAIAARYGIKGIPTLIVFDHGKVAKQHAGLVTIDFLRGLAR